jgi:hypothetical protein
MMALIYLNAETYSHGQDLEIQDGVQQPAAILNNDLAHNSLLKSLHRVNVLHRLVV